MNELIEKRTRHTKNFDTGRVQVLAIDPDTGEPTFTRPIYLLSHQRGQHYHDGVGWTDTDPVWDDAEKGTFGHKAQKTQHHARLYRKGLKKSLKMGIKKNVEVEIELQDLEPAMDKQQLRMTGAFPNADLEITNYAEGIQLAITLQPGHGPQIELPITTNGCVPEMSQGWLIFHDNVKPLGYLRSLGAEDTSEQQAEVPLTFDGTTVRLIPNQEQLAAMAYPVTITARMEWVEQ